MADPSRPGGVAFFETELCGSPDWQTGDRMWGAGLRKMPKPAGGQLECAAGSNLQGVSWTLHDEMKGFINMKRDGFIVFTGADTGIRADDIIFWLPGAEAWQDENGNPVRELNFTVRGNMNGHDYTITIQNPQDVKRFLAGVWSQSDLVRLLSEACEHALEYIDTEYNDGDVNDTRPRWGECQELDDLYNQLHKAIAVAKGKPFTPRE